MCIATSIINDKLYEDSRCDGAELMSVNVDKKYIYEVTSEFFTFLILPPSWRCIETKSILFAADYVPEERVVEDS